MKKLISMTFALLMLVGCSSYQSLDLSRLVTGMTKADVIAVIGRPQRLLAVNDTRNGFQEVLEYRTSRDEVYALEFWNDRLTGYEFLYDDYYYVPPVAPPVWYGDFGRPIVVYPNNNRPNRPGPPTPPNRPNRPNTPNRPNRPNRPEQPNRPTEPNRPSQPNRPSTPNRQSMTRPTPGVGPGAGQSTSGTDNNSNTTTPDRSSLAR